MPPRHGKSELCSATFPAWYLGHFPDDRVILGSYESNFARSWGRKSRELMREWGPTLFGVGLSDLAQSQDWWDLAYPHRGGMNTAGVGGSFTGKGANLAILEDPIKDASEARSASYRSAMWDWWQSTFYTRFEPDAVCVIILTRWNEDDLVGRLQEEAANGNGEEWETLNMPAIAEEDEDWGFWQRKAGDALWENRHPKERLEQIKSSLSAYWWTALYQQKPRPEGGSLFDRTWYQVVDEAPAGLRQVRYWDLASTEKRTGNNPDWTVGVRMGEREGRYWVLDVQRFQAGPGEVEDRLRRTALSDGIAVPQYVEQEGGANAKLYMNYLARVVFRGCTFRPIPASGSKELRAEPFSAASENHLVSVVKAVWNRAYFDELEAFPNGKNDDQVDGSSGAYGELSRPAPGRPAAGPTNPAMGGVPQVPAGRLR